MDPNYKWDQRGSHKYNHVLIGLKHCVNAKNVTIYKEIDDQWVNISEIIE